MRTLVVYDSVFGNTERIALAVRASLLSAGDATAVRAAEYKPGDLSGVDFLVVGSPTRAFSPTKAVTSFLKGLPEGALRGVKTAAFDTRIALKDVDSEIPERDGKTVRIRSGTYRPKSAEKGRRACRGARSILCEGIRRPAQRTANSNEPQSR